MRDVYAMTMSPAAVAAAADGVAGHIGGLHPMPRIVPGDTAAMLRVGPAGRALAGARWGMPPPSVALRRGPGVAWVRNVRSVHWSRWLAIESRCAVPFTSFAAGAGADETGKPTVWLALGTAMPLGWFAGIWTRWASLEGLRASDANCDRFAILACRSGGELQAEGIEEVPVILPSRDAVELWLTARTSLALELQRPPPNGTLVAVPDAPAPLPTRAPHA